MGLYYVAMVKESLKMDYMINDKEQILINAKEVHKKLKVKTKFYMWIGRRMQKYKFLAGVDFCTFLGQSSGGRPEKEWHITIDVAKQLCMVDESELGMKTRRAYIKLEEKVRDELSKQELKKLALLEVRKSMTEKIQEHGENERMHGHAYSTYTKLAYKLAGVPYDPLKGKNFRDTLNFDQKKRTGILEAMIKALLEAGKQYGEIKESLSLVFKEPLTLKDNDKAVEIAIEKSEE